MNSTSFFISDLTSRVTLPFLVNLNALLKKFVRHCLNLVSSCDIAPTAPSKFITNSFSFFAAKGDETSFMVSTISSISKLVINSSIFPASIFERSKILLIKESR